jgi:wyosine [tRNA(Phe)-imidazoG37] synthetase (radical SAM superfamily)
MTPHQVALYIMGNIATERKLEVPEIYKILIEGHLQDRWEEWFEGLKICRKGNGTTTLSGSLSDQAALHGVLLKIGNMNLKLISINQGEENIENNNTYIKEK